MSILKRFLANETNLSGPDFNKADFLKIDLSGTSVFFKNPPLTCMIPYKLPITTLDINTPHSFKKPVHDHELVMTKQLNENGWNFYSGISNGSAIGGMITSLSIFKSINHLSQDESFFVEDNFINWILKEEKIQNDWLNNRRKERHESNTLNPNKLHLFSYPTSASEITKTNYNNYPWYSYTVKDSDGTEKIIYRTPVSREDLLSLTIKPSCYRGDYYSDEHNLQEVISNTIEDLMRSMQITLSADKEEQARGSNSTMLALESV